MVARPPTDGIMDAMRFRPIVSIGIPYVGTRPSQLWSEANNGQKSTLELTIIQPRVMNQVYVVLLMIVITKRLPRE